MKTFDYVIVERQGFHARNTTEFAKAAQSYACKITVSCEGKQADGRDVFALMGLAAGMGQILCVAAEGEQEATASKELKKLLERIL